MSTKYLYQLDKEFKLLLIAFLVTLSFGVMIGLSYLYYTTKYSPERAIIRYNGSVTTNHNDEFEIPEDYPKPISELFVTTHNHIITFSFIFFFVTIIFYFSSMVTGWIKKIFLIEPFISIIISFSSLWAMRFLDSSFVFVIAVSSSLLYISYFLMVGLIIFELIYKKSSTSVSQTAS